MWTHLLSELSVVALAPLVAVLLLVARRTPWWLRAFIAVATLTWVAAMGGAVDILYDNWRAGCLFAPAEVPYQDGMSLCPGQRTALRIEIPLDDPVAAKPLRLRVP